MLTAFPASLVVTVTANNSSEPVAGGLVTFTSAASGASASLSGSPATISATGTASATATANGIVGSYTVSTTASGITTPASFSLKNEQLIIALDPSASAALNLAGNASINTAGVVCIDSSSSSALSASGNAQVKASAIDVHGKVQKSGNASLSPTPVTGAPVLAVASLPLPSTTGITNHGSFSLSGNSSQTIQPGIYSSISVSGNAKLTMASGIYIIEGGGFSVSGNASVTVTGAGVMIFNAGSKYSNTGTPGDGGTYGSISLSGNGACSLSPMTSGPYAGIVFFQPSENKQTLTVTGNVSGITGTIYAPGAGLSESGNGSVNASLVVDTITISGNGVADVQTAGGGASAAVSGLATTAGGTTAPSDTINTAAVIDPTTPSMRVGTISIPMTIKVTDALGNNVSASGLPVVSLSTVSSNRTLVPQTALGTSDPDNLFTFDPISGSYRFSLKTKGYKLGS